MSLALTEFALHLSRLRWPPNEYFQVVHSLNQVVKQLHIVTKLLLKTTICFLLCIFPATIANSHRNRMYAYDEM